MLFKSAQGNIRLIACSLPGNRKIKGATFNSATTLGRQCSWMGELLDEGGPVHDIRRMGILSSAARFKDGLPVAVAIKPSG